MEPSYWYVSITDSSSVFALIFVITTSLVQRVALCLCCFVNGLFLHWTVRVPIACGHRNMSKPNFTAISKLSGHTRSVRWRQTDIDCDHRCLLISFLKPKRKSFTDVDFIFHWNLSLSIHEGWLTGLTWWDFSHLWMCVCVCAHTDTYDWSALSAMPSRLGPHPRGNWLASN